MTSLAQSDSAGVCPVTNGPAPLSAAADLVVGGMCPPFFGPVFLSVEHPVGAALRPPLAALPLTAAAYPLRVPGGPSPRARPFAGRPPYGAPAGTQRSGSGGERKKERS